MLTLVYQSFLEGKQSDNAFEDDIGWSFYTVQLAIKFYSVVVVCLDGTTRYDIQHAHDRRRKDYHMCT